jgi:hypothetical protein
VMVPVSCEPHLRPGPLEFAMPRRVQRWIDTSIVEGRYPNEASGCPAYAPQLLLKRVLGAYARGSVASRTIEHAGREQITCMALSCARAPDHSPMAGVGSSRHAEMVSLVRDVLRVCEEPGW